METTVVRESPIEIAEVPSAKAESRFYRPELDALRFFAFFSVLIHHGPHADNFFLGLTKAVGDYGLSMFFLLSGYLITELLLREHQQTGTVVWMKFFIRRALRIWPLYFAALAIAVALALIAPQKLWVSWFGIATMSVFCTNWVLIGPQLGVLIGHLWSISVEEQFYLIWAPVIKFGGKRLVLITSLIFFAVAGVWLAAFSAQGWKLWFQTPVEFLFFAAGALIALQTSGKPLRAMSAATRGTLFLAGLVALYAGSAIGCIGIDHVEGFSAAQLFAGYGCGAIGCGIIFFAALGMPTVPRLLIYLGKISYGLYVFHIAMLKIATQVVPASKGSALGMMSVDAVALILSIAVAHVSYQYLESPFLRLKERFTVIQSRPA